MQCIANFSILIPQCLSGNTSPVICSRKSNRITQQHANRLSRAYAIELDRIDHFQHKCDPFALPDDIIYLCGNSLGPMPKAAPGRIEKTEDWAQGLVGSWNKAGWLMMTDTLGDRLTALLGASAGELVVCDGSFTSHLITAGGTI